MVVLSSSPGPAPEWQPTKPPFAGPGGHNHRTLDPTPLLNAAGIGTDRDIAARLGVSQKTVFRWRHGAPVRIWLADECAVRIGAHPAELWPDWCDA